MFKFPEIPVKSLLEMEETLVFSAGKELMETTKVGVSRKNSALKESQLLTSENVALRQLVAEEFHKVSDLP